jgi:hypothetical protein
MAELPFQDISMKSLNGVASVVGILLLAACQTGADVSESWLSATVVDEAAADAEVREFTVQGYFGMGGGHFGHPRDFTAGGSDGEFKLALRRLGDHVPPTGSYLITRDDLEVGSQSFNSWVAIWNEMEDPGAESRFARYVGTEGTLVITSSSRRRIEGTFHLVAKRDCGTWGSCTSPSDSDETVRVNGSFSLRLHDAPVPNLPG